MISFYLPNGPRLILTNKKFEIIKTFILLFEAPRDPQPILCFNIIPRSKRYRLFPILSGLIEPSFRNFRIALLNGLFSPVGIGGSIPFLRTVLESFLPHTAPQSILLVSFFLPIILNQTEKRNEISYRSIPLFGVTKRG